ncbi:MAG TPA: cytochrome b/b6 domain-containing protein [Bradyrhizobium sp.]|nr:cytochrome b/b6 domain-containing protein [Bradyrhizobium sp.]
MIVTPSTFLMIEGILAVIVIVAAGWYLYRRLQSGGGTTRATPKYHPLLVLLHWFVAFALANLLLRGALIMRYIPNSDPEKIDGLRAHMYAGILVLTLMVIRLVVRRNTWHPPRATARNRHLDHLAWVSHRLLYVLVIAQALSGLYMALQTGLPGVLILGHGALPEDFWVFPVRSVHYLLSRLLMATIALHIAGALYHTFLLKDGLLRRMSFGRRIVADDANKLVGSQGVARTGNASQAL